MTAILYLFPSSTFSLTVLPKKSKNSSRHAARTIEVGERGDEKGEKRIREGERERETEREGKKVRDPFDVLHYNTSQSQLKGFVKNA